ncbi:hypothetical protein M4951_03765 [Blastopirellula sp. J2-11]|uniref:hypothetical protein n=1 Tax=Blastopirellula sp. J2-11 TaxID=2943192 RepID=UPI0021C6F2BA|nr:hypothetical protein [Blastopirellula sp. J2-11]UUO07432.1 hypothetical protein M4951_03765 [Blastopirellula sp. J2-11]
MRHSDIAMLGGKLSGDLRMPLSFIQKGHHPRQSDAADEDQNQERAQAKAQPGADSGGDVIFGLLVALLHKTNSLSRRGQSAAMDRQSLIYSAANLYRHNFVERFSQWSGRESERQKKNERRFRRSC